MGAVLYNAGIRQIDTVGQLAKALEPLTVKLTYLLFAVGVIGTGLLAILVMAGSLSYILADTFNSVKDSRCVAGSLRLSSFETVSFTPVHGEYCR